jgi:glycosyltransferase involved in cell wall biosynthesis
MYAIGLIHISCQTSPGTHQFAGARAMIDALIIHGPFHGPTGYDRHVRGFARALHELGVAIQLVDLPEWGPARLPPELRDPWFDSLNRPIRTRTLLHFCMPPQVRLDPKRINVIYTMFEATPIPRLWAIASAMLHRVIVPTASSALMWEAGGVHLERFAICPLGIDPGAFASIVPGMPMPGLSDDAEVWSRRKRFLTVAEVNPRKNLSGLVRAWLRATNRYDDAVLLLKPGFYAPGSRERLPRLIAAAQAETGVAAMNAAPIHIIDRLLPDAEMPSLFGAATHYVSLSFGEGWDQPMVEAGAAGLRLIAPAHSAYQAYLDPSCATLIPSRPVPAGPAAGPELADLYADATWWEPDEEAAVAAIRAAIAGQDAALVSPRERILRELTWERAARRLLEILEETSRERAWQRPWRGFHRSRRG